MEGLQLNLFGKPEILLNGAPVTGFESAKSPALLFYLAVTGQAHSRDTLATLLWGDLPEVTARRNLTKALTNLRQLLEPYLLIDRHSVAFNHQAPSAVDVTIFQAAVEGSLQLEPGDPERDLAPLRQAVSLYRGDFLEGFYVKNALEFEEWALGQREYLRELMLRGLRRLTEHSARLEADPAVALAYCQRWLALEPWQEAAHRQMMLLLVRTGQRDAALAQYETCRQLLAEELGVEPMAETVALFERIKAAGTPPPHNLPPAPNPFVGREAELDQLAAQLAQPACRLLTVLGPGGIGKTRLALEAARRYLQPENLLLEPNLADGIYIVSLASIAARQDLSDAAQNLTGLLNTLISAIAEAVNFSFHGATDLKGQLLTYLRSKAMLLILDNFEHLLAPPAPQDRLTRELPPEGGLDLLAAILQQAPQVKLLVTSRERLNLQEEYVLEVEGLAYPGREDNADHQLLITNYHTYSAIDLFVQRAQQTLAGFTLAGADLPHVARICRLVEGVPLGLELAAAWLRTLSCAEVVSEIERSLDFLASPLRNLPARHRSLRAVFEHSWDLLAPEEQRSFCQLAVFRGGFTREAAARVAGASVATLARLADKSFVRRAANNRHELHELMRQYAGEKLWLAGEDKPSGLAGDGLSLAEMAWQRHSSYYLNLAARQEAALYGSNPQQAAAELRAELDNIRQAWRWAVTNANLADIEASIEALAGFYEMAGFFQEGLEMFGMAVTLLERETLPAPDLICHLVIKQAWFFSLLGAYEQAKAIIERALALSRQAGAPLRLAEAQAVWGQILKFLGEMNQAIDQYKLAVAAYRTLDQPRQLALTLSWLGDAYIRVQMFDKALDCLQEALRLNTSLGNKRGQAFDTSSIANIYAFTEIHERALAYNQNVLSLFKELDYPLGVSRMLNNIGLLHYYPGHYAEALASLNQALQIHRRLGNEWDEANTLENLGAVYTALGDYAQAQQSLERALALFGSSKMGEAYVVWRLGQLYTEMGDYQKSRDYLQRAIALGEEMNDTRLKAICTGELGLIFHRTRALDEALACYSQAVTELQRVGARYSAAQFIVRQAQLLFELDAIDQAQTLLAEGIQLAQEFDRPQSVFDGRLLQAKIAFARGDREAAAQQLQALRAAAVEEAQQAALHYELAKMGQGQDHIRLALTHYQQICARTPNIVYQERLAELQAITAGP